MLDSAEEAMGFVSGLGVESIHHDRMLALALVRCIEIVGEAANGLTTDLREAHPRVPWRAIVAMRNRLVHGYFDVDLDRVWDTVTEDLPALVEQLREILSKR